MYRRLGKRCLDAAASAAALLLLAPLLAVLGALVRIKLGRPVLFVQSRPGLDGKPFPLFKFRTMMDARGPDGSLLPDARRLVAFGRFLRSSSLDELPELFNVLKGEMSLVGPRPLLMQYLPHYSTEQARRHETRPGITGWAQVNGRNAISWEDKFKMDVWYVDHIGLVLDFRILCMTLLKVLRKEGTDFPEGESLPYFTGSACAKNSDEASSSARKS